MLLVKRISSKLIKIRVVKVVTLLISQCYQVKDCVLQSPRTTFLGARRRRVRLTQEKEDHPLICALNLPKFIHPHSLLALLAHHLPLYQKL